MRTGGTNSYQRVIEIAAMHTQGGIENNLPKTHHFTILDEIHFNNSYNNEN